MQNAHQVNGAFSKIFIQYEGSLKDLGDKMENKLSIPEIRYENMDYEPYESVGYSETLGFEIEIKAIRSEKWPQYHYTFEAITTDSFKEISSDRMFDISIWMARYISLICGITTLAEHMDKQTGQSFYYNKLLSKRESSLVEAKK